MCNRCTPTSVPAKATAKLANGNTGHAKVIGIILCFFPNCSIIYPVGTVYYCLGQPSHTISSGNLKFNVGSQKFMSEPLEHCDSVDTQGSSWRSPCQNQNNLDYIQIKNFKVNPHIYRNIVVPNVCAILKQNISQIIHKRFGNLYITRLKQIARKGLMEGLLEKFPELE